MSGFLHFQHSSSRMFNNCIKLYWHYISSSWNLKGGQIDTPQKNMPSKIPALLGLIQKLNIWYGQKDSNAFCLIKICFIWPSPNKILVISIDH